MEIWIALLSLLGTIAGSGLGVVASSKLVDFRLKELEKKVDKHNHLVERMVVVEQRAASAHKRLDSIEERGV